MKKYFLSAVFLLIMMGFAMAEGQEAPHHYRHYHHYHHHHHRHHRPMHH